MPIREDMWKRNEVSRYRLRALWVHLCGSITHGQDKTIILPSVFLFTLL